MTGTGSLPSFYSSMPPLKDMADVCMSEIPSTTHFQGQGLDLYSALQIHLDFHTNAPIVWCEIVYYLIMQT